MAQKEGDSQNYAVDAAFFTHASRGVIKHENLSGNAFYEQLLISTEEEPLNTLQCLFVFGLLLLEK